MTTELLAPAGDRESLAAALRFGADAVYIGGETLQLRAKSAGFDREMIVEAVKQAHEAGKRLYVAMNSLAENEEIPLAREYARFLRDVGVDAVIVSDIGVLTAVRASAPDLELHLSTQASCMNYAAAQAWHDLGVKRIVLAREMSLDGIAQLRAKTPPSLSWRPLSTGPCVWPTQAGALSAPTSPDAAATGGSAPSPAGGATPSWRKSAPANTSPWRRRTAGASFSAPTI